MRVRQCMSPDPTTIGADAPVGEARRMIAELGVRHLPVVDVRGRLAGMLSDRDVRAGAAVGAAGEHPRPQGDPDSVAGIMSHPVHTVDVTATIAAAARLMLSRRISAAPVVDGDKLIGLVTSSDCLLALLETLGDEDLPENTAVMDVTGLQAPRDPAAESALHDLDVEEAMVYLAGSRLGRLAFVRDGKPDVVPLNCRWHAGAVIVRIGYGPLLEAVQGGEVVFEVDGVDGQAPWSVVVHGRAEEIWDPEAIAELDALGLRPWAPGVRDHYVQIRPTRITGRVIEPA